MDAYVCWWHKRLAGALPEGYADWVGEQALAEVTEFFISEIISRGPSMSFARVSVVGDDMPPGSASATTPGTYSGYHLLMVRRYSNTKQDTPKGECIKSRPFRVGGYRWCIEYYPNGYETEHAISIYLVLNQSDVVERVNVDYGFSFVDPDQNLDSTLLTRARKTLVFWSTGVLRWSLPCIIETEIFEKSKHLSNDSFTIRCDISLTKDVDIGDAAPPVSIW
ncbi:hypothetical protein PR202_gb19837 [Eleusine coracana subsp. coracana]|uniref:MATH domain-containing protein n=1 Tax=Eleusine coracana subsp. coracana TaxID=191504 RepID=A0AAV5F986_ELECO|nr:hypothetical protein PR202_gb19837 [Eleusine coracana subsp. coracana]